MHRSKSLDTGNAIFTREAWKVVAQGGWWKAREIVREVPLEVSVQQSCSLLLRMVQRGALKRRGSYPSTEYSVTPDCIVPYGLSVKEILRSTTGGAKA